MQAKQISKIVILVILALGFLAPTASNLRTAQAATSNDCHSDKMVLYAGGLMVGSTCLDENGWHTYSANSDPIRGNFYQLAVCSDGSLIAASSDGLFIADKGGFKRLTSMKSSAMALACTSSSDVWASSLNGLDRFDGKHWTSFDMQQDLGAASSSDLIGGIGIAPDKTVWVATSHALAAYNGSEWKVLDSKQGLDESLHLNGAPVFDSKGVLYVPTYGRAIVTYDGSKFDSFGTDDLKAVQAVAVDAKNNVYVGTNENGLFVYDGSDWKTYTTKDGLGANNVQSLSVDGKGRVWAATEWGLSVLEDGKFTTFTMANSGLVDNQAKALVVTGDGPDLPTPTTPKTGTVKGAIQVNGKPLANTKVQLCSLSVFMFSGDTPCGDMPDSQTVTTDAKGAFQFDEVPIGRYGLAFQAGDKGWARALGEKVEIAEGRVTNLNTLKFTTN